MNKIRKMLATGLAIATLLFSTTLANAGIIIAGAVEQPGDPCTDTQTASLDDGIIIAGFTGIIIAGFTGIIIAGAVEENPQDTCGIIIAG